MTATTNDAAPGLAEKAMRAAEEAAQLQADLEAQQTAQASAADVDRRTRAREVFDRHNDTEAQLISEEATAYQAFLDTALADPVIAAYIAYRQVRYRRTMLRNETRYAAYLLGENCNLTDLTYADPRLHDDVLRAAEAAAGERAADQSDRVMTFIDRGEV